MGDESTRSVIPPELAALVSTRTGIDVGRGGLDATLREFVKKRCSVLGHTTAAAYFERATNDVAEQRELLDAVSIPHTWFFRDREQLELALDFARSALDCQRPLRIWIPGCATGEEAYSVAILAAVRGLDVTVLATDMSQRALDRARAALYDRTSVRELPDELAPYFVGTEACFGPRADVRSKVTFEQHNLVEPARTTPGGWDLILCRNVVIYFSRAVAVACVERLGTALAPHGALVLGAGELAADSLRGLRPTSMGSRIVLVREGRPRSTPPRRAIPERFVPALRRTLPPAPIPKEPAPKEPAAAQERRKEQNDPDPIELLLEAQDLERVGRDLRSAARRKPTDARVHLCLGVVGFTRGDYRRAVEDLTRALELAPELWPAALYRGLCFERTARRQEALVDFQRAGALVRAPASLRLRLPEKFAALAGELLDQALRPVRGSTD